MRRLLFLVVLGVVASPAACNHTLEVLTTEQSPLNETEAGAAAEACSNGPRYGPETVFAGPFAEPSASPLNECVPHCGPQEHRRSMGFPTTASLPSGECSNAGARCTMGAEEQCPCPPGSVSNGPYSGFECRCEAGQWACTIVSKGMSMCACVPVVDGG